MDAQPAALGPPRSLDDRHTRRGKGDPGAWPRRNGNCRRHPRGVPRGGGEVVRGIPTRRVRTQRARAVQADGAYLDRAEVGAVLRLWRRPVACVPRETRQWCKMSRVAETSKPARRRTPLNRSQIAGFWGAWTGWTLDGMDSFIYALVLTPALTELLPRSGIAATTANVGLAGSILFAMFLVGWGLSFIWGPIADRYGRTKVLAATIFVFAIFTGA